MLVVLVFLTAAYQLLDEMPTRETGEVKSSYSRCEVTLSIYTSYQTQSVLGQVRLIQATKQVALHHFGWALAGLGQAYGPSRPQPWYQTCPK
jgi:hypothetical protein